MSLFSLLFGCKEKGIDVTGPDFNDVRHSVIHLNNSVSVEYALPGNMSKEFGFDKLYEKSEHTKNVNFLDIEYKPYRWRHKFGIDSGMWEYVGPKNVGVGGRLGSLNVRIEVNRFDWNLLDDENLVAEIFSQYKSYADKENDAFRRDHEGYSDDELKKWLYLKPEKYEWKEFGGGKFLSWAAYEQGITPIVYYLYRLDNSHFLTFVFDYGISVSTDQQVEVLDARIVDEIEQIMRGVKIAR